MANSSELENKGLKEAFGLSEKDIFEAKYNLLGLFNALYKIDQRLKNEKQGKGKETEV